MEEQLAGLWAAAVDSESEFVEVVVDLLVLDAALVRSLSHRRHITRSSALLVLTRPDRSLRDPLVLEEDRKRMRGEVEQVRREMPREQGAKNSKKKLLYIINRIDWFWSHRMRLAQGATEGNWEVFVAATGAKADRKLTAHGFRGIELPRLTGQSRLLCQLAITLTVQRLLRELRPDLVHIITLEYACLAGLAARLHPHMPIVFTITGLGSLFLRDGWRGRFVRLCGTSLLRLALRHPRATVIFQNSDDRDQMIAIRLAEREKSTVIRGSGVDTTLFRMVPESTDEAPLVLMPARLIHEKGIIVFVEAAHLLKERGVKARFYIAGGLETINPNAITETEIRRLTADGVTKWLGKVVDMPALYAKSTLIAYPSFYGEGTPKVLLEAAASGRAIITTDHVGCREVVIHGGNGLLIPVKDVAALANAIEWLLTHPEDRLHMAACGRVRAETEFSIERVVAKTLAVYRKYYEA